MPHRLRRLHAAPCRVHVYLHLIRPSFLPVYGRVARLYISATPLLPPRHRIWIPTLCDDRLRSSMYLIYVRARELCAFCLDRIVCGRHLECTRQLLRGK